MLPSGGAAGTPIIPSGGAAGTPVIPSGGAAGTPVFPSGGAAGTPPIEPVGGAAGMGGSGLNPDGTLPPVTDYGAYGPFTPVRIMNTGPGGAYTMVRPEVLGQNGFKHPLATWGNGIITTPAAYVILLDTIASHGFVIIASNSTNVTAQMMTSGLDWLIQQNTAPGEFQGMLDPARSVSIGYSLGGGAAVNTGSHPNVITTVSFHGLQGAAENLHGPLLLFTSTGDTFVSAAGYVTPTFNRSTVQTFYATLIGGDHLTPLNDAGPERAPAVAWLRLWVYGDQAARVYFDGPNCILCTDPWTNPRTKNWQ